MRFWACRCRAERRRRPFQSLTPVNMAGPEWRDGRGAFGSGGERGRRRAFRRHVLYIPGYDPFPPRRYRELYRKEGAEQAAISGYELTVARAGRARPMAGSVSARFDGRQVEAEVEVLVWSDLVKASMERGVVGTYWLLAADGLGLWRLRARCGG